MTTEDLKKTNLVFFIIVQSFTIFIVINLVFLSLDVNKSRLDDVKIKVNRGEILDRNGEVLAASIDTKDFYINTSKILEQKKLISELKNLFPNKSFESTIEKKK